MKGFLRRWGAVLSVSIGLSACEGRVPATGVGAKRASASPSTQALALFDLSKGLPEEGASNVLGLGIHREAFDDLLFAIDEAKAQPSVKGAFVRFGSLRLGYARALELGQALAGLRSAGKKVLCHGEGFFNASYLAAARGCDRIAVTPAGDVETIGLSAEVVYLRSLLADQLHVQVDILQVGKSKGAAEPLTRDGPSVEARASLEGTLASLRGIWLETIFAGRGAQVAKESLEDGPYSPNDARARGLVDDVLYADEARESLSATLGTARQVSMYGGDPREDHTFELFDWLRTVAGEEVGSAPIALVKAVGSISMGGGEGGPLGGGSGISERALSRVIGRLTKDPAVKAVVLRIDSPGGSALASDLLWQKLMKLRATKPLVVSVGEMAASGGYYLASTAHVIVADPMSIVGSIGVVGGKVGIGGALERWGVHTETFTGKPGDTAAKARAAYMSMMVPWDEATRGRVLNRMTGVYNLFLARVAEGRRVPQDVIEPSAEGRIFSGVEAKERKLVDEMGGLWDALQRARQLAQLPDDAEVMVVGSHRSWVDALGGDDGEGESETYPGGPMGSMLARMLRFGEGRPWGVAGEHALGRAWESNLGAETVPFVGGLLGLARGEVAAVTLPFGLWMR